jgi:hypothetical protein
MSIKEVKSTIEGFVQNGNNDLLTIKGAWGVGKTHFWRETVRNLSQKAKIGPEHYSYISLFGIDSVETLKNSIIANQVPSTSVDKDPNLSIGVIISKIKNVFKHGEKIPYIRNFSGGLVSELAFQFVKDTLICIDDLERKGDNINIKDILGLASFLKEQRNCKVVFILNDGTLGSGDKEEFQRHHEKVVDLELNYSPSSEEVFEYYFDNADPHFELIKHCCLTLDITNIRILQRIRRAIRDISLHLTGVTDFVIRDIIRSIILYVWSYYNQDNKGISLDFLEGYSGYKYQVNQYLNKEVSEEDEQRYKLLLKYGYGLTDKVDSELIEYVRKGYVSDTFFEELRVKNQNIILQRGREVYDEAWKLYKASFRNNEEEFLKRLENSFRENYQYLGIQDLHNAGDVLDKLGKEDLAKSLVDDFFARMMTYEIMMEMKRLPDFDRRFTYPYFVVKLDDLSPPPKTFDFDSIINKLTSDEYVFQDEIGYIAAHTEETFYDFFKGRDDEFLHYRVKSLLKLGKVPGATVDQMTIYENTKRTLLKIAGEGSINHLRISSWFKDELGTELESRLIT